MKVLQVGSVSKFTGRTGIQAGDRIVFHKEPHNLLFSVYRSVEKPLRFEEAVGDKMLINEYVSSEVGIYSFMALIGTITGLQARECPPSGSNITFVMEEGSALFV